MSAISLSQGWLTFLSVLFQEEELHSLAHAAAWMFRLNVTARNIGRHPITDQIYELKNEFIKYLYQHGFCTGVKLHSQKRLCRACGGDGVYWNGEECYRCDGTGIYAVTPLYAFQFEIEGKRYAWHQLRKLVDYPVTLSDATPGAYYEPDDRREDALSLEEAWRGCCVVWLCLRLHGVRSELLLFNTTRIRIRALFAPLLSWYHVHIWYPVFYDGKLKLVAWWHRSKKDVPVMEPDEMEYYAREFEERMKAVDYEDEIPF